MVNVCCVPGCKSGYASERKKEDAKTFALFKFPGHDKEPQRRAEWVSLVPRKCWKPNVTTNIYICELHFEEKDFIKSSTDTNERRKRKKDANCTWENAKLKRKRLNDDAKPSIWPRSVHLSKLSSLQSTSVSSNDVRKMNVEAIIAATEKESKDKFDSLDECSNKVEDISPEGLLKVKSDNCILLVKLAQPNPLSLLFCMKMCNLRRVAFTVFIN